MLNFSKYKVLLTLVVIVLSTLTLVVGYYKHIPMVKGIQLGLDLKGGAYLTLVPDFSSIKSDYQQKTTTNINNVLEDNNISYSSFTHSGDHFSVTINNKKDIPKFSKELLALDDSLILHKYSNHINVSINPSKYTRKIQEVLQQSVEVIRRRIDQFGTNEPVIKISGNSIIVEIAGVKDPSQVKKIIGTTARLSFNMVDNGATFNGEPLPVGYQYMYSDKKNGNIKYAVAITNVITGKHLKNAALSFDRQNQPAVSFSFDKEGAEAFREYTSKNIGKIMAIVLDGKVISAPQINSPIITGSGIIEGHFTLEQAQDLALLLKAGSLPVPLKITSDRTIGPSLGAASIKAGTYSLILGSILVFLFMFVFYRKLGLIANVSLIFNTILMFACLSIVGGTLTLPGIAGIVLSTGMAVDSNILVYERYNYEIKYAKPYIAMTNAFNRVYQTLLDSNVTTLFASLFLFYFGTGPIRGFAVTLIIGILTSMFSIFFTTRMLVSWFYIKKYKG